MTEERIRKILRREAEREWRSTPDLWPSVRERVQLQSGTATGSLPSHHDADAYPAATGQGPAPSTGAARRSWPWELGKMAAGGAVVALVAIVLAAVFSGQQGSLPGTSDSDDEATPTGASLVTEGEVLITRWSDEQDGYELAAVDARTGEESQRIPSISMGTSGLNLPVSMSPGGSKLAVISADETMANPFAGGTQIWPRANLLTFVDIETSDTVEIDLPADGWVPLYFPPRFNSTGERLALVVERPGESTIMLFDSETGDLVAERTFDGQLVFLEFHPERDEMVLYYQDVGEEPGFAEPSPPEIAVVSADTLEDQWSLTLEGIRSGVWCAENCDAPIRGRVTTSWSPGMAVDQRGDALYIAHVDQPVIERIDLSDQSIERIEYEIEPDSPDHVGFGRMSGGFMQLRVGPESERLYLLGGGADVVSLGFIVLDLGENRARVRVSGNTSPMGVPAESMTILPDRSEMLLSGREFLARYDLEHGFVVQETWNWTAIPSLTLDGEPILLAFQDDPQVAELGVIDVEEMEVVASWEAGDQATWASLRGWPLE